MPDANTETPCPPEAAEAKRGAQSLWLALLAVGVGALAVSNESFWIDEAATMHKAVMPTFGGWWERMLTERTSNLQLPLYLIYAWAWEKLAGAGEWAMRAGNIPWFALAAVAMGRAFGARGRRTSLASCVTLFSAFAWFYVNDARPYAMQMGAGCLVFAALVRLAGQGALAARDERRWAWALALGAVILAASGMLAMLWLGGGLAAVALANPWARMRKLLAEHAGLWLGLGVFFSGLGVYYLWTLTLGARATMIVTTDARSVSFIFYELFGLGGLGPGRVAIRTEGLGAFKPFAPALAVYGGLLVVVLIAGWQRLWTNCPRRALILTAAGLGGVLAFLLVVGVATRFRVLGRHCAPLWPVLLFGLGLGVMALWEKRGWLGKAGVAGFVALSLASCLSLRFAPRHAKDDYRGAARVAQTALAQGEKVWWNADDQSTLVYGVPTAPPPGEPGKALLVRSPYRGFDEGAALPDLIISSKPDVYDPDGLMAEYRARHGFRPAGSLPAFTLWRRNGN